LSTLIVFWLYKDHRFSQTISLNLMYYSIYDPATEEQQYYHEEHMMKSLPG
jgi:hypothetical protein